MGGLRTGGRHRTRSAPDLRRPTRTAPGTVAEQVLQLQRTAGNRAVLQLIRARSPIAQRKATSTPENAPVTTLQPAGTLSERDWTAAHRAAKAKPSLAAYEPLFRDIAKTAGMAALGSAFVPAKVPTSDGKTAAPGLNLTLDRSDDPGHTGWVDNQTKTFGAPLKLTRTSTVDVSVGMILSPNALTDDKGVSLTVVRHEMVHVKHKQQVLAAIAAWRTIPARRRPDFDAWLDQQAKKRRPMAALEVALVRRGAKDGAANTEVLAYVEGFVNEYHRRPPTADHALLALIGLLGAVETSKLFTWQQADKVVQDEAMLRLREYHAQLDPVRQRNWKDWLDRQRRNLSAKDTSGRRDFFARLAAFVV